jgi:3-phosphoshikimate 1-carboxyvinyltransferase
MTYKVSFRKDKLEGQLLMPASKSLSNRFLIIRALSNNSFQIENLSDSDDTRLLEAALSSKSQTIDIHHAGTAMRFLTAFFAATGKEVILTGSERMRNRPIAKLVDALRMMGAEINYTEKDGFPPLHIKGNPLQGGKIKIDPSVSSQYVSALLMIAPTLPLGLELELSDKVISSSYITMTEAIMQQYGVKTEHESGIIRVAHQNYRGQDVSVEGDWSGVSYWYQMAAFAREVDLYIDVFSDNSLQGDARVAELFARLGVKTEFTINGIHLTKRGTLPERFDFNFIENPDLVQTFAVTLVMLGIPFRFEGCQTLKIKETDRIVALQNELFKFGAQLDYEDSGILSWNGNRRESCLQCVSIPTYQDHRMAMAFAPIGMCGDPVIIQNPEVVAKSYPSYWDDLEKVGFEIEEI